MHIDQIYRKNKFVLSFEFMPPRNGEEISKLYSSAESLLRFKPSFLTVTQGSQASLRSGTFIIASELRRRFNIDVASHMICINKNQKTVENELIEANYLGIENLLALRGDPPWGESQYSPDTECLRYANDLILEIQKKNKGQYIIRGNDRKFYKLGEKEIYRNGTKTGFCIAVAGYPEGHKECKDKKKNIEYLRQKVDSGASIVFTQMFFDDKIYFEFVEDCRKAGINVPIVPGIMPISFFGQISFLKETCAVSIPQEYEKSLTLNKDNKEMFERYSSEFVAGLCSDLIKKGVPGLHFYTLNNSKVISEIIERLDLPGL